MKQILETERLTIRELTHADSAFIIELLNTDGWLRYIGDRNVHSKEDAIRYLNNGPMKSYVQHGYGLWLVCLKDTGTPIGMCGLIKRDYLEHTDIGFAFLPAHNGKGYALESASAVLDYAKDTLRLTTIAAFTVPYNADSVKLIEKLGLRYKSTFELEGEELWLYQTV
ncbi:MAG: N-acetyltransferase [Sphingobacteriales bacterium]|nr:MAG: N-acetyltransferase [Sphingobacteriales bacterium]